MEFKNVVTILFIFFTSTIANAQKQYYFGIDIGPKFDQYKLVKNSQQAFSPNIKIYNPLAATFGVLGGMMLEEKYQLEAGIYKSDFRVNIDLLTQSGDKFFVNTPINTFTSYMIPINFNVVKTWQGKYEPRHFIFGTGFTILANTKLGIAETFFSPEVPIDPQNSSAGAISYVISDNTIDGGMVMLNLNLAYRYPINESVNISVGMNSKIGVAGTNYFNISHSTPNFAPVKNRLETKGSSVQFNIGFRYFLESEEANL